MLLKIRVAVFLVVLGLYSASVEAADKSVGADFSNNLLSDLAPLIALFGEQVAKQYLSQSMHWLEHVIFACAPLGMITAITCAIRVAGDNTLKAIIGRAREPAAQAEIEVMSSTSTDVCEMWNGVGLVRIAGYPDIIELLYDRLSVGTSVQEQEQEQGQGQGQLQLHGVYGRAEILEPKPLDGKDNSPIRKVLGKILSKLFKEPRTGDQEVLLRSMSGSDSDARNISLNTTNPSVEKWELRLIASVGVALQLGVLVFDWLVINLPQWQWMLGGLDVPKYAFPLTSIGTLAVSAGMFLCAQLIELSTVEIEWSMRKGELRPLQILWLQRGQTVNDQRFKSYAIYASRERRKILTSRPLESKEKHHQVLSTLATVISICGFVFQFVGLRSMHYSATLSQLVAMAIMTMLRVVLRRNLSVKLETRMMADGDQRGHYVEELQKDYELDFVAKEMLQCSAWSIITNGSLQSRTAAPTSPVLRVLNARVRLGQMADQTWKENLYDTVMSLSETMETLMNHLHNPSIVGDLLEFKWTLPVTCTIGTPERGSQFEDFIDFKMDRNGNGDDLGPWKMNRAEIEAALSLWMSHLSPHVTHEVETRWIIGLADENGDGVGKTLCDWWISRGIDYIEVREITNRDLFCIGSEQKNHVFQGIVNTTSPRQMCAQFFLTQFMTAVAKTIGHIDSDIVVEPVAGKRYLKITNKLVDGLADILKQSRLATTDDAYRIIVPALFEANVLPDILDSVPAILRSITQYKNDNPSAGDHTKRLTEVCKRILGLCLFKSRGFMKQKNHKLAREECMRLVKTFTEMLGRDSLQTKAIRLKLREFGGKLTEDLIALDPTPTSSAACVTAPFPLHEAIGTGQIKALYDTLTAKAEKGDIDELSAEGTTPLSDAAKRGDLASVNMLLSFGADPAFQDSNKKTTLHAAMNPFKSLTTGTEITVSSRLGIVTLLLDNGADININDQTNATRDTPLHLAADQKDGEGNMVQLLFDRGAHLNLRDGVGRTAIRRAAENGNMANLELLLKLGGDADVRDNHGMTALHKATENGHLEVVRTLIGKYYSDPFLKDIKGRTIMHIAAAKGQNDVAEYLVKESSFEVDLEDEDGRTAMHYAAEEGEQRVLKILLDEGWNPDLKDHYGQTAAHAAASKGRESIIRILHLKESDLDAKDNCGRTVWHCAAEGGHTNILGFLIGIGHNLDLKDNHGETAMMNAACKGHLASVELLLQNGADPYRRDRFGRMVIHKVAEMGIQAVVDLLLENKNQCDPDVRDNDGRTAVHIATRSGHVSTVDSLIQQGCSLDIKDNLGKTALHLAVESLQLPTEAPPSSQGSGSNVRTGIQTVIDLLLKHKDKYDPNTRDKYGKTAMHIATEKGHVSTIDSLIQKGCLLDVKDNREETALHLAVESVQLPVVELLLKKGSDPNIRNNKGETALHIAAGNGSRDVIDSLLSQERTNRDIEDNLGRNALHRAAEAGKYDCVVLLAGKDGNIGTRNKTRESLIHAAAGSGSESVLKHLLERGENPNVRDTYGRTPLHKAVEGGHGKIVRILIQNGADIGARDKVGRTAANIAENCGDESLVILLGGTRRRL